MFLDGALWLLNDKAKLPPLASETFMPRGTNQAGGGELQRLVSRPLALVYGLPTPAEANLLCVPSGNKGSALVDCKTRSVNLLRPVQVSTS